MVSKTMIRKDPGGSNPSPSADKFLQMNILHYSDKSASNFDQLYMEADLLITTGDLTLFDFGRMRDENVKKPSMGVYGNHDSAQYLEELGIINLHNKVIEFQGLTWGGWQGCLRYKNGGGPQFIESEALEWATNLPRVDVLLLHAGPKGMLDDPSDEVHIGSEAVRDYVISRKPKFVFCGHQYSDDELIVGDTKIFRTYGARLIPISLEL